MIPRYFFFLFVFAFLETALAVEPSPFDEPGIWKFRADSTSTPLSIYYVSDDAAKMAEETLKLLEDAWAQSKAFGFRTPTPHNPIDSDRFAAFLVQGDTTSVEAGDPLKTATDTVWPTYFSIAPWGVYGGVRYRSTIVHEFHHTIQAMYDWEEPGSIYEMSANYIQEHFVPNENDDAAIEVVDFQARPEWAPHYYDDYKTYFMYGAWLYLKFLELYYFDGKPDFVVKLWEGAAPQSDGNPTWIDSLNQILPKGITYVDTIVAFAKWRTFSSKKSRAERDMFGKNFLQSQLLPAARVHYRLSFGDRTVGYKSKGPQLLGTHYVELHCKRRCNDARIKISSLDRSLPVRWKIQRIPRKKTEILIALTPTPKTDKFDLTESRAIPYRLTVKD